MLNETHEKSLGMVMSELKLEMADFVQTRYQMLSSEIGTKFSTLKSAAPILMVALALCGVGFMVVSAALVAVIAMSLGSGIEAWAMACGLTAVVAWRQISNFDLTPTRTIGVLKQDQVWLQNEARSQL